MKNPLFEDDFKMLLLLLGSILAFAGAVVALFTFAGFGIYHLFIEKGC